MRNRFFLALAFGALASLAACADSSNPPAQSAPGYPPPYSTQYPPQPYPPQQYPPGYPQQPPPGYPQPVPQPSVAQRPLLAPLVGSAAMQQEIRSILAELMASLNPIYLSRVRGVPWVLDPTLEVNAYAACDNTGAPFLAGTQGLLDAIDAIAQTRATDELFGTQTFDAYCNAVVPQLVRSDTASAALPQGIIPPSLGPDPRRWSRAHEIFDEIAAFTFGHELGHHYLGHTGCANGQANTIGPNPAVLGQILTSLIPAANQPNEVAADSVGAINALDTGLARQPSYRFSEKGGLLLLQFFSRLESAAGVTLFNANGFLQTHPNPTIRIPIVQGVARGWYAQHPNVPQ